jgi:hypothetical protein
MLPFVKRTLLVQRIGITLFFVWHAVAIGVLGISYTISDFHTDIVRKYANTYIFWYARTIGQTQHNWGFFAQVPNASIRFSIEEQTEEYWIRIDEISQVNPPYIGNHNQFNFLRSLADLQDNEAQLTRWLQHYCADNTLSDTTIRLNKRFAELPKEAEITPYTWRTWQPKWMSTPLQTYHCPHL